MGSIPLSSSHTHHITQSDDHPAYQAAEAHNTMDTGKVTAAKSQDYTKTIEAFVTKFKGHV